MTPGGYTLLGPDPRTVMPRPTGTTVTDLPASYYLWHRGAQRIWPENSLEGFRNSLAAGALVIKTDVYDLADGALAISHDATVDRTTTGTGNVTGFNLGTWRNLAVDAGSWFAPTWPNLTALTLEDVLDEFGGKVVLMLDAKRTQATARIITAVVRRRLQSAVMLTSSDTTLADAALCKTAQVGYLFYYNGAAIGSPTPAAAVAAGATALGIGLAYSDANITSVVAAAATAGVPVHGFTVQRKSERDRLAGLGITIWHCNDPAYVASTTAARTTDQFATGTPYPGLVPSDAYVPDTLVPYTGNPRRLAFPSGLAGTFALLGYLSPLPATYTLSGTVTFDTLDADTSRWAAIGLAGDDRTFNGNAVIAGYNCLIRQTGAFQIFRQDPGTVTNGVTATGTSTSVSSAGSVSAPTAGGTLAWSLAVNGSQVVFTVGGSSVTSVDTTYRPLPYVHVGKANGNNLSVSYSNLTVS